MAGRGKNKDQGRQMDAAVVAAIHSVGTEFRVVVARLGDARPQFLDSRTFPAAQRTRIDAWLEQHRVGQVVMVVPSSHLICRICPLPDLPENQLEQALHLHAEAHLLGAADPHRLGMAVLPTLPDQAASGLILAWPTASNWSWPEPDGVTIQFAGDTAGIAALVGDQSPSDPVIWSDSTNGAVAVAMPSSTGINYRSTREEATEDAWGDCVRRVVVETALGAGLDGSEIDEMLVAFDGRQALGADGALVLPGPLLDQATRSIEKAPTDAAWWSEFGVVAGVLLARSGPMAPLTTMLAEPPDEHPHPIQAIAERLSQPRTATTLVVVALLLLALGPMALSGLRLMVLQMRHDGLDERLAQIHHIEHKLDMYTTLEDEAWPMTKLFADVFSCAPIGVELETIHIAKGEQVKLRGTVAQREDMIAQQVIGEMNDNMLKTGVFSNVNFDISDEDQFARKYDFTLNADIIDAHKLVRYDEALDFEAWTYEERFNNIAAPSERDGTEDNGAVVDAGPGETTVAKGDDDDSGTTANPAGNTGGNDAQQPGNSGNGGSRDDDGGSRGPRRDGTRTTGGGDAVSGRGDDAPHVEAFTPPPVLTQAQVDALTEQETREALSAIAEARKHYKQLQDEEMEQVYKEQFDLVFDHMKELRGR